MYELAGDVEGDREKRGVYLAWRRFLPHVAILDEGDSEFLRKIKLMERQKMHFLGNVMIRRRETAILEREVSGVKKNLNSCIYQVKA